MKKLFLFVLSFVFISCIGQQYSKKWTDLNYADDGKGYHLLDIYLPKIAKANYPVVVYIYGSAWMSNSGKSSDMNTVCAALLNAGYAIVSPNHRSNSDSLFPAQINDIKAVIRFARANCSTYSLDTTFIGISGSSSGGHLAALAGATNNIKKFTIDTITMDIEGSVGKNSSFSSEVDAVCDWFGPTDLLKIDSCRSSSMFGEGQSPEEAIIGCTKKACYNKFKFLNPITYIGKSIPPYFIFHGDADQVVPYCESEVLNNALQKAGAKSELVIVPGGQHYGGVHIDANFKKMVEFFNSVSGNIISTSISIPNKSSNRISTNYSNQKITISNATDKPFNEYELIDISGKTITQNILMSNEIDISVLQKGIYFLKLHKRDGSSETNKFIKI